MRGGRRLSRAAGIGSRHLQMFSEKIGSGVVGLEPTLVGEKAVDFIREDELLELDVLFAQGFDKGDCLMERYVAIVVAMNQQDG